MQSLQRQHQFTPVHGLDHVGISAGFQALKPMLQAAAGGEHQHPHAGRWRQVPDDVNALGVSQAPVHHDQGRLKRHVGGVEGGEITDRVDLEPCT